MLGELPECFRVFLHAYVLMRCHFHMLLESREANLSGSAQWLNQKECAGTTRVAPFAPGCGLGANRAGRRIDQGRYSITEDFELVGEESGKTCPGGSGRVPSEGIGNMPWPAPERRLAEALMSQKGASGILFWLNRDPIGEEGGLNLYGFVGNNGVNGFDVWGLTTNKASSFTKRWVEVELSVSTEFAGETNGRGEFLEPPRVNRDEHSGYWWEWWEVNYAPLEGAVNYDRDDMDCVRYRYEAQVSLEFLVELPIKLADYKVSETLMICAECKENPSNSRLAEVIHTDAGITIEPRGGINCILSLPNKPKFWGEVKAGSQPAVDVCFFLRER